MWSTRIEQLPRGLLTSVDLEGAPAKFSDILRGWRDDSGSRTFFIELLAHAPYDAFRWETPPITVDSVNRPFEFVLLNSPKLAVEPNPSAFAEHLQEAVGKSDIVSFSNLKHDAILVVPRCLAPESAYGHLAAFVRHAPESQKHLLWKAIGEIDAAPTEFKADLAQYSRCGRSVAPCAARSKTEVLPLRSLSPIHSPSMRPMRGNCSSGF
jgi:hypothetical protein